MACQEGSATARLVDLSALGFTTDPSPNLSHSGPASIAVKALSPRSSPSNCRGGSP